MKPIQSFVPYQVADAPPRKEMVYFSLLSSLLLKEQFGEVKLYTNESQLKYFEMFNFPYTEIDTKVLEGINPTVFSFPKMYAMRDMKESYIHFDMDSFLLKPIDFDSKKDLPYYFAHPDFELNKIKLGKNWNKNLHKLTDDPTFKKFYNSYLRFYLEVLVGLNPTPKDFHISRMNVEHIPNYALVGVNYPEGMKEAIDKAFLVYEGIKEYCDRFWYSACFIEQFCITHYLRDDLEFAKTFHEKDFYNTPFMFTGEMNLFGDASFKEIKFPATIHHKTFCNECYSEHVKTIRYNNPEHFSNKLPFDEYQFIHLTGNSKYYDYIQARIIATIVKRFGEHRVKNVYEKFLRYDKGLSPGEKLYEKLSGNKLFSKKSLV